MLVIDTTANGKLSANRLPVTFLSTKRLITRRLNYNCSFCKDLSLLSCNKTQIYMQQGYWLQKLLQSVTMKITAFSTTSLLSLNYVWRGTARATSNKRISQGNSYVDSKTMNRAPRLNVPPNNKQ